MGDPVILAAKRTPIGKFLGSLSSIPAPRLGAIAIAAAIDQCGLAPQQVDEVIMGNVLQAGLGQNPARQSALAASLPDTVAAFTVNKVCGSGLKSVMCAAQAIRCGDARFIVAGGMESMSRAPHLLFDTRTGWKFGDRKAVDAMIRDGLWCPFEDWHMGEAAEYIGKKCGIAREDMDRYAVQSHRRAAQAWQEDAFRDEIVPVETGEKTVQQDEGFRTDTSIEKLARLKPSFQQDGCVTAGNASMLSDGAAALVVADRTETEHLGTKPLARIVSYATSGVHPKEIFIAPVSAIRMALEKANLSLDQIDLFELNEAFAAQMLACNRSLEIPEEKVNVHGGAIALGHPIGASGARVLVTLLYAMRRRDARRGVAALCLGGGNAVAMVVERE